MGQMQIPLLISVMATQFLVMGGGIILLARVWQGENLLLKAGYTKIAPAYIALGLIGLVGIFPIAIIASEWLYRLIPELKFMNSSMAELLKTETPSQAIWVYATIALSPAICEELTFRGFFHRHLQARLRGPWAWIISGSFFALIHYNYFGLPTLILIGCYLGFLYHYSGSIWPGMLVHLIYNAFIIFLNNNPGFANLFFDADGFLRTPILLYGAPFFLVGIGGILLLARRRRQRTAPAPA
jgi:membrane protease YdiL (CAAX protease family)